MYLNNRELYIELVVSKAQGRLTRPAQKMLELLAKKTIKKMRYWSNDDKMDCYQSGLLYVFQNWYNFNEEKSVNAFAYFTEIFKRGIAKGYNDLYKKKGDNEHQIRLISIEGSNDGMGLHSLQMISTTKIFTYDIVAAPSFGMATMSININPSKRTLRRHKIKKVFLQYLQLSLSLHFYL